MHFIVRRRPDRALRLCSQVTKHSPYWQDCCCLNTAYRKQLSSIFCGNFALDLEADPSETLEKDPRVLFNQKALQANAKLGMIATDNTDPVFLVLSKLPDSTVARVHEVMAVCRGHDEMAAFLKKYSGPGLGSTTFEFVGLMHRLATNLAQTHPIKRGRSTI